jgi:hypothetical protein
VRQHSVKIKLAIRTGFLCFWAHATRAQLGEYYEADDKGNPLHAFLLHCSGPLFDRRLAIPN